MISLEETKDYEHVLRNCYNTDVEFLEKYHDIAGSGLDKCVGRDVGMFQNTKDYVMYKVFWYGTNVGYFGIDKNFEPTYLCGFFVNKEYRSKQILTDFWNKIKDTIGVDFVGACSSNNTKAEEYLKKRGGEKILKCKEFIIYKFKN